MLDYYSRIGAQIKVARDAKKMTLKELGKRVGISESMAHRYEKGNIRGFKTDRLSQIADALGVSAEWIVGWEGQTDENRTLDISGLSDSEIEKIEDYIRYIEWQRGKA